MRGVFRTLALLLALAPMAVHAQQSAAFRGFALSPPCEGTPQPAYAHPGGAPAIASWTESDNAAWQASPCLRWTADRTRLVTALSASLHADSLDELLARYGALSRYRSIRFWSIMHQAWENFVTAAGFTDGPDARFTYPDLVPDDFQTGKEFYYYEIDRAGRTLHQMTVRHRSDSKAEITTENLTAVRFGIFTIFEPHALKTATFIERQATGEWGYYQTIGVGQGSDFIAVRSTSPYINRLIAFYRYMAGIPTDSLPPVAPR